MDENRRVCLSRPSGRAKRMSGRQSVRVQTGKRIIGRESDRGRRGKRISGHHSVWVRDGKHRGFARTYDDSKPPTSPFARPHPPAKTDRPVGIIPDPSRMANPPVGSSPHPIGLASGHRIGCPDPDAITASRRLSVAGRSRTRLPKYRKTSEVYGQSHDIQPAVIDKATVPIDYESRIAKLSLNEAELPKVNSEFEEITEAEAQDQVGRAGSTRR